jgi:hypothetical protein
LKLRLVTETFCDSKDSVLRPFRYLKAEVLRRQGAGFWEVGIDSQRWRDREFPAGLKAAKVKIKR